MSLGGQITEDDIRRYMVAMGEAPAGPAMTPYMDPTAMAQQAILARPMRPSFTGQPLLSREVPLGIQGDSGLAYPSMASTSMQNTGLLNVPNYTSRYAAGGGDSGGSGYSNQPSGTWSGYDPNSYTGGLLSAIMGQQAPAPVSDMGTSAVAAQQEAAQQAANQALNDLSARQESQMNAGLSFDGTFGSEAGPAAGLSNEAGSTAATAAADNSGNTSGGGGKIVCTAMNQQYGFGSFRNAIWLKYSENNLTKAHEAGYHAIFLPLVDFAFKQGDGKLNMLTRKLLENCARHRSLDLRAEMRGTKRDTIGMIYRSVLEPLCYAVGKIKGY